MSSVLPVDMLSMFGSAVWRKGELPEKGGVGIRRAGFDRLDVSCTGSACVEAADCER